MCGNGGRSYGGERDVKKKKKGEREREAHACVCPQDGMLGVCGSMGGKNRIRRDNTNTWGHITGKYRVSQSAIV